jgi:hypothetical protein
MPANASRRITLETSLRSECGESLLRLFLLFIT